MAKIIAIDGKVRTAQRRLVTDTLGARCCCADTGIVYVFVECCDRLPRFVLTKPAYEALLARCAFTAGQLAPMVRRPGSNVCYSYDGAYRTLTREQAVALGYEVIEDSTPLVCVDTTRDDRVANRCNASPRDCRPCPRQCCLVRVWRKNCPDPSRVEVLPKANVCCNYGRVARRTRTYSRRYERDDYTFLNASGSADPFCPPGCYVDLLAQRTGWQENGREVARFTACDADLNAPANGGFECIEATHYQRQYGFRRRWPFADFRTGDANCLAFEDIGQYDTEQRSQDCTDTSLVPATFPARIRRTLQRNLDGSVCNVLGPTGDEFCDDSYQGRCSYVNERGEVITSTTTYRYSVSCRQGSFYLLQETEVRHGDNVDPSCPELVGALIRTERYQEEATFSILTERADGCPTNVCDGYAKDGTVSTFPVLPGQVLPAEGAFLFL